MLYQSRHQKNGMAGFWPAWVAGGGARRGRAAPAAAAAAGTAAGAAAAAAASRPPRHRSPGSLCHRLYLQYVPISNFIIKTTENHRLKHLEQLRDSSHNHVRLQGDLISQGGGGGLWYLYYHVYLFFYERAFVNQKTNTNLSKFNHIISLLRDS